MFHLIRFRPVFVIAFFVGVIAGSVLWPTHYASSAFALLIGFISLWGFVFTEAFGFEKPTRSGFQIWTARVFLVLVTLSVINGLISIAIGTYNAVST